MYSLCSTCICWCWTRIFQSNVCFFNQSFRKFAKATGISGLVPHTARHSGPTDDLLHGRLSEQRVALRGRWSAPKSVRRYTKPGRMLALAHRLPPAIRKQEQLASGLLIESFFDIMRLKPVKSSSGDQATRGYGKYRGTSR